jgi:hypothetical protein
MSGVDDLLKMAENNEKAAKMAVEAGARFGYDASRAALEYADIARQLRLAAAEIAVMPEDRQASYVSRMKAAVWARLDDSPELADDHAEAHP